MSEIDSRTRRVWRLLPIWTMRDVRAQYRQSTFDIGWSLLTPMITVAGFGLVLSYVFGVEGEGAPYVTFAWAGVVIWTFVATGLTKGASSLVWSADLVRKVAFPKEVVPLAAVASATLDLAVGMVVLGGLMAVQGVTTSVTAVAVLPVLAVAFAWTCGVAVLLATLTVFIRDVAHGLAVVLRVGIFVTPVMYPASAVPEQYRWLLDFNAGRRARRGRARRPLPRCLA